MRLSPISLFKTLAAVVPFLLFAACDKTDNYIDWKEMNTAWYEEHKTDDGFTLTESGLSYRLIEPTANPSEGSPNQRDYVYLNYTGRYIDGTQFDSSANAGMYLSSVVSGFREAILKMTVGDSCQFYIPYPIGYGTTKNGNIPPYTTLIFDVRLIRTFAN